MHLNFRTGHSLHRFLSWQVRASAIFVAAAFRHAFWKFAYRTFVKGCRRHLFRIDLAAIEVVNIAAIGAKSSTITVDKQLVALRIMSY
jgi:hypothetical protein